MYIRIQPFESLWCYLRLTTGLTYDLSGLSGLSLEKTDSNIYVCTYTHGHIRIYRYNLLSPVNIVQMNMCLGLTTGVLLTVRVIRLVAEKA